jgi:hypothetical protein
VKVCSEFVFFYVYCRESNTKVCARVKGGNGMNKRGEGPAYLMSSMVHFHTDTGAICKTWVSSSLCFGSHY